MTGFLTLAAILWAVTITGGIALLRRALAESSDRPSLRHRDEQGATHRNAKLNRSVLPGGSVHHHHGSVSK